MLGCGWGLEREDAHSEDDRKDNESGHGDFSETFDAGIDISPQDEAVDGYGDNPEEDGGPESAEVGSFDGGVFIGAAAEVFV